MLLTLNERTYYTSVRWIPSSYSINNNIGNSNNNGCSRRSRSDGNILFVKSIQQQKPANIKKKCFIIIVIIIVVVVVVAQVVLLATLRIVGVAVVLYLLVLLLPLSSFGYCYCCSQSASCGASKARYNNYFYCNSDNRLYSRQISPS